MDERSSENLIFRFSDDLFTSLTDTESVFCFGGGRGALVYGVQFPPDWFHKGINDGL